MTDISAFLDWLWSCDPKLAVRAQAYHDEWRKIMKQQARRRSPPHVGDCIIDDRYRVRAVKGGLALHNLKERDEALIAIYEEPGPLFADLITHSTRRSGDLSDRDFIREATRLIGACEKDWFTGPRS